MADAGVIKDFLVGIGFKVDQTSQQQFAKGVDAANQNVKGLQAAATGAGQALQKLGQHFKAASDEPVRKFAEGTRRISMGMDGLRKGTIELGRVALATGGAFAAGIIEVTKNFQELYYTAQRVGVTVSQLVALRNASEQAGKGAGDLQAQMEELNRTIIAGGGPMEAWIAQFIGGRKWSEIEDKARGTLEVIQGIINEYRKGPAEAAQALLKAQVAHIDPNLIMGGAKAGEGSIERQIERYDAAKKAIKGIPIDEFAEAARKLQEELVKVKNSFYDVFVQGAIQSVPGLERMTKAISGWLTQLKEYNKTHPEAAQLESFGMAAAGVFALEAAFKLLTGRFILLNPYVAAFAGAAALIIYNWDTIGPFLEKQWTKIYDDIQKRDWKKLGEDIVNGIREGVGGIKEGFLWDFIVGNKEGQQAGKGFGEGFFKGLRKWFESSLGEDKKALDDFFAFDKRISGQIEKSVAAIIELGKSLANALVQTLVDQIPDWVKNWFGIGTTAAPATFGRGATPPGGSATATVPQRGDPFSATVQGPGFQGGGIVSANLHEGEMVLPAPISRGLQALIHAGTQQGGGRTEEGRGLQRLGDWLSGAAAAVPGIQIENWEEFFDKQRIEEERKKEGAPFSATVQGPGMPRGMGGDGDGVPDTSDPNLVGNEFLKSQRARFAKELEENPEEKLRFAALLNLEDPANKTAMPESLLNRQAMTGRTLMDPRGGMMGGPTGSEHPSFYDPQRKGLVEPMMERLRRNPQLFARLWAQIQKALEGSNLTKGATDQGMPGDPNYGSSNIIFPNKEGYGPWGGFKGVPYSREWARKQQEQVNRMGNTTLAPSGAVGPQSSAGNGGDKNVDVHVTQNITINGAGDPHATATKLTEVQRRLPNDLIRHLKPALV